MRYWLATLAVLIAGCSHPTSDAATPSGTPSNWKPILVDVQEREHRPFEDPETMAVVFLFVLEDCPIANSYLPELNRLHDAFESRGVQFFIVETDPQGTLDKACRHSEQYEVKSPVIVDLEHSLVKHAGATKTPEAAVFSPAGELLYRGRIDDQYAGLGKRRLQATSHDLQDTLEAILSRKPVANSRTEVVGCYIPDLPAGGR